jgi:sec-independent protein translocase protein TatA
MVPAEIFGPDLLIVVIVIAVVIFGGAAIPKLARSLGSAKSEFEKGIKTGATEEGEKKDDSSDAASAEKPPASS